MDPPQHAQALLTETLENADFARVRAELEEAKQRNPYVGWTERKLQKERKKLEGRKGQKAASDLETVNQELKRIKVQEDVAEAIRKRAEEEGPPHEEF